MAITTLQAESAHSNPVVSDLPQMQAVQQLFATLGRDGAGALVDALLDAMDAADGDGDDEDGDIDDDRHNDLEDGDVDCCEASDDCGGGFIHRGYVATGDDEDSEPDETDFSMTDPAQIDRIRQTRCIPRYRQQWHIGGGRAWMEPKLIGYELKCQPIVPRSIRRMKARR